MQYVNGNFKIVRESLKKVYKHMKTLENWRKTVLFVCLAALAIDPLFFFVPVIDSHRCCLTFEKKLGVAVCVLRTFIDAFYVIHIMFQFTAPRSQVSLRGEIVVHSKAMKRSLFLFYIIVDILSVLPIPQVVLLTLILSKQQYAALLVTKQMLKWVIICQNIPRIIRFYPLFKEVTRASGTVAETKWIGAALNFSLYMLQSHAFGAFWYLGAIETKYKCWREACAKTTGCHLTNMYCARRGADNSRFLNTSCPVIDPNQITNSTIFNFGMYTNALKSGVVESMYFPRKFFYCFWWGLRNLSALGQNLETSNSVEEIVFAILICASGLLLFAVLIGNVQEIQKKKWRETRGTEEDAHLRSFPKALIIEIKRHLYLDFLKKVPEFQALDDRLLDELCARLKTVRYTKNSYIVREGDSLEEMFFIMRGNVMSFTTYGERTRFLLRSGDFCGDLLTWTLDSDATHFPISSRTIQALTEVEVFVLSVDDLKFVSTLYLRLHSKEVKHMFRYYSVKWKTWAARIIQVAWERHCRRKLSKALREEKGKLQNTLQNDDLGGNKLNLGAAVYALRFASKALKSLSANAAARNSRFPHMLTLLPQKPADPEFPIDVT